jgi:hypothetical protein
VVTFGVRQTYDKAAFIKANTSSEVDPTASQALDHEFVIVDGDTGVLVSKDTARGTRNGKPYEKVWRFTTTYVRRNGRWLALAEQGVELPAE